MTKTVSRTMMVSWEVVDTLYEHHFDCLRKISFFVKAGNGLGEEGTALEVIAEFLKQKEDELQELRQKALAEREKSQSPEATGNLPSQGVKFGTDSIQQEDRAVFDKLREMYASGGDEWQSLRFYIESHYVVLKKRPK